MEIAVPILHIASQITRLGGEATWNKAQSKALADEWKQVSSTIENAAAASQLGPSHQGPLKTLAGLGEETQTFPL